MEVIMFGFGKREKYQELVNTLLTDLGVPANADCGLGLSVQTVISEYFDANGGDAYLTAISIAYGYAGGSEFKNAPQKSEAVMRKIIALANKGLMEGKFDRERHSNFIDFIKKKQPHLF